MIVIASPDRERARPAPRPSSARAKVAEAACRAALLATTLLLTVAEAEAGDRAPKERKVETWHDRAVDFDAVRVFATPPLPPGTANRLARGVRTREDDVRDAVVAAFAARGYTHDPDADVIDVELHAVFTPPEGPRSPGRRAAARVQTAISGSFGRDESNHLYVELRDPESGQPIWRGRVRRVLGRKQDDQLARLRAAAHAIAEAFPPPPFQAPERPTPPPS